MKDNLHTQARERLFNGVKKVAEVVGGTMGTGGYNVLIQALERPGHLLTNDGITIAQSIHFADPLEEMGKNVLLEAVSRSNKAGGDGSSTTCVLTASILEEGLKHLDKASPMEIKNSLEECLPLIEESINKQKVDIVKDDVIDLKLLEQVATISAEDASIGKMIAEIYSQIGLNGIIHWDISKTFEDNYTIGKGITVDGATFVSPYMADLDEKTGAFQNTARYKNPHILITKQKIMSANDFNNLFQTLFDRDIKEIVVFCDEYEPNIVADLIRTRAVRGFKTLLIKMPTLFKDWWYADLAKATGATVIDPNAGISLKLMKLEHLGTCENLLVDKENTYLDGIKDVSEHIQTLTEEGSDDSLIRASRLNTATARYFVGAGSDSALSYRRLKVEDALHSAYYALREGIVAGGGSALACVRLPDTIGGTILGVSLKMPAKTIGKNVGMDLQVGLDYEQGRGFDTRTKSFVNMFESGIVDTSSIVLNAVRNALSVSASILTAPIAITYPEQEAQIKPNL